MANASGDIPLSVSIDAQLSESHTSYNWTGGGRVLTLSTVLPDVGVAAELISAYVGHDGTPTIATHLRLGPVGQPPAIHTAEHAHEHVDPVECARDCVYDHARQLAELLRSAGHEVAVQLDEHSFTQFEHVE